MAGIIYLTGCFLAIKLYGFARQGITKTEYRIMFLISLGIMISGIMAPGYKRYISLDQAKRTTLDLIEEVFKNVDFQDAASPRSSGNSSNTAN